MPKKSNRSRPKRIRVSKSELALRAGVARATVIKYLADDGAPKADRSGKFDAIAAAFYVGRRHARSTAEPDRLAEMRARRLALQLDELERAAAAARGEYVRKADIEPAIAAFCSQLTEDLRNKFEFELPPKYEGLDRAARGKLNAEAIDFVLTRLKNGAAPVSAPSVLPSSAKSHGVDRG